MTKEAVVALDAECTGEEEKKPDQKMTDATEAKNKWEIASEKNKLEIIEINRR